MPKATVTLKEGKSYTYKDYTFTSKPTVVTDAGDIASLKGNANLNVVVEEDKPVKPLREGPPPKTLKGSGVDGPEYRHEDHTDDEDVPTDDDGDGLPDAHDQIERNDPNSTHPSKVAGAGSPEGSHRAGLKPGQQVKPGQVKPVVSHNADKKNPAK